MLLDKESNFSINEITLKSVDKSVQQWFDIDYPVYIDNRKVGVLYATSERWARAQKEKGFRDEKGTLILPLISIRRTEPTVMKERFVPSISESDITFLSRVATVPFNNNERQASSVGVNKNFDSTISTLTGKTIENRYLFKDDNVVYEILQIPFPSFIALNYDVVVWASYMSHQNIEQENILSQFKGGRQYFKVDNYFFFGTLTSVTDQSNLEDFSDKEKIIKYIFKLTLQAYLINKKDVKFSRSFSNVKIRITESSISSF